MTVREQGIAPLLQSFIGLRHDLSQDHSLESEEWVRRHRGIVLLLCLYAVGLPALGLLISHPVPLVVEGGVFLAIRAGVATVHHFPRRLRAAIVTCGLILSSALFVHISGGFIESHVHFFAMMTVIVLYQD